MIVIAIKSTKTSSVVRLNLEMPAQNELGFIY